MDHTAPFYRGENLPARWEKLFPRQRPLPVQTTSNSVTPRRRKKSKGWAYLAHTCFHSFSPAGLICPLYSSRVCRQKHTWESLSSAFSKSSTHDHSCSTLRSYRLFSHFSRWRNWDEGLSLRPHREQSPQPPGRGLEFQTEGPHRVLCPPTQVPLQQTPLPARHADRHFHLPQWQLWTLLQWNNCPFLGGSH